VPRLCRARDWTIAIVAIATGCCVAPARAADAPGFVSSYSGSQVMVYVSWAFASHGNRAQTFGLRYERASPVVTDPASRFCAPLAHRSLVDLQFARGSSPRMQFGPRVTWDISHGRLAPTDRMGSWTVALPAVRLLPSISAAAALAVSIP
jgi:hypothetical protein